MSSIPAKGTGADERIARYVERHINALELEIKKLKERVTALESA